MIFRTHIKQNERGRSMVEILGVLAIIGVLSFGGIQGYRYAMEKHRANDIVNEVNLRTRDTWNMYQTKDLPDDEEIIEWADTTQTGFPIGVYPRSEILFDVEVENVPNGVCKKVLGMDIQGPLFIWVPNGEERLIYNGNNPEICGEDGDEAVNMVFTTSLESFGGEQGLRENPLDPNGRPLRYCMSDDDCRNCESCDTSEYTCKSNCPDATPFCHSTNEVCVSCESNSDCQNNNICNEEDWTCEVVPERCEDGYFRSKNGACIKCDYPANILINPDEQFLDDKGTGAALCSACPSGRNVEGLDGEVYCSKYCTSGISFASSSGPCIPCDSEQGYWAIQHSSENHQKCLACSPNHWWYNWNATPRCTNITSCASDEYMYPTESKGICHKCDHSAGVVKQSYYSSSTSKYSLEALKASCEACSTNNSEPNKKRWWVQYGNNGGYVNCFPQCEQPADAPETCTNYKICNRKFQGSDTKCYDCSVENAIEIGYDTNMRKLCTDCGREVSDIYCIVKDECNPETEFRGLDGKCYSCTDTKTVQVKDEDDSGCATNCANVQVNGYTGREIISNVCRDQGCGSKTNICRLKCNDTDSEGNRVFQSLGGSCIRCDDERDIVMNSAWFSNIGNIFINKLYYNDIECNVCNTTAEDGTVNEIRRSYAQHCKLIKPCDGFTDQSGNCYACNKAGSIANVTESECNKCSDKRIWMTGWTGGGTVASCIYVEPGVTGVCNDIGNANFPPYDDSARKMLRDSFGKCYYCDTTEGVYVGHPTSGAPAHNRGTATQQCVHCGNRRYDNYRLCHEGLCDSKVTFLSTSHQCISCTTTTVRVAIPTSTESEDFCTSCEGRRVMTTGTAEENNLTTYCVKECAAGQWQNVNGTCRFASDNYNEQIGSDALSKNMCRETGNHLVYTTKSSDGKTTYWYCSKIYEEGTNFVKSDGNIASCTTGDTQIPDTQDSKNLCRACLGTPRIVETDEDGSVWCVKE